MAFASCSVPPGAQGGREVDIAIEVVLAIAEQGFNHHQPLEVMAYPQFVSHADAAMQLHSVLRDKARGAAEMSLRRGDKNGALGCRCCGCCGCSLDDGLG